MDRQNKRNFGKLHTENPDAIASVKGSSDYPKIHGAVYFYKVKDGTLVVAEIYGLPRTGTGFHGFHIHENGKCTGNDKDPFANTGSHYSPHHNPHPRHAGDLPPLLASDGYAFMSVHTSRFNVSDVIGKAVVIHENPDDFKTQPSGDAGKKIACGVITV